MNLQCVCICLYTFEIMIFYGISNIIVLLIHTDMCRLLVCSGRFEFLRLNFENSRLSIGNRLCIVELEKRNWSLRCPEACISLDLLIAPACDRVRCVWRYWYAKRFETRDMFVRRQFEQQTRRVSCKHVTNGTREFIDFYCKDKTTDSARIRDIETPREIIRYIFISDIACQ